VAATSPGSSEAGLVAFLTAQEVSVDRVRPGGADTAVKGVLDAEPPQVTPVIPGLEEERPRLGVCLANSPSAEAADALSVSPTHPTAHGCE